MEYIFVFTFSVLILNALKIISVIVGNTVTLPGMGLLSPTNFLFLYPSLLYQVWFWSTKLEII